MAIKRIKLNFSKLNLDEEVDDVIQDLVDFSMDTSSTVDALFEGHVKVDETLVDKKFETLEKLKTKLRRMQKLIKK